MPAPERLMSVLGRRARELVSLPVEESVAYELVTGVPWIAFNRYQGGYASRIEVNADLPVSVVLLVTLAAHEAYPGHHTERAAKEAGLLAERRRTETALVLSLAPEALVSEGIATNALEEALGPEPFDVVAEVLADLGVRFDPAEVDAIHRAEAALDPSATNAAFLLHEDGVAEVEVEEYLRTWALESNERSARTVSFLTDPESRSYVSTYADGKRLCRSFADSAPRNFTRLLTEQLTVADLLG